MLEDSRRLHEAYALTGEVDMAVTAGAEDALVARAVDEPGPSVVFDCAELTFIDASGVNMLLSVARRSGKVVRLDNLIPSCRRVFEVLGLCDWFGIEAAGSTARCSLSF